MDINFVGVIVAAISGMALGALWYSPVLFGNAWMEAVGLTEENPGSATTPMIGSMVASVVTAFALAWIISMTGVSEISGAVLLGLITGGGLVFTAMLSDNLFCGWGFKLLWIQTGYRVLTIVIMCVVIVWLN